MSANLTQILASIVFLLNFCLLQAQDIHFSQFSNSPANLNPALTGMFNGDLRFIANYRNQWKTVPVDYRTVSTAFDAKLYHKVFGKNGFLGYGLVFNNDVAGDAQIGISQLGANVAYNRKLGERLFGSVGVQLMVGQRSVSPEKLTYEEQWNGDQFDPNSPNGEAFQNTSKGIFSAATGFNLGYLFEKSRSNFNLGLGIFNLNQPNTSFKGQATATLPLRPLISISSNIQVASKFDVRVYGIYALQSKYREANANASLVYHISTEKNKALNVQAGAGLRIKDAIIPMVGMQYKNWTASFSYDVNTSNFQLATGKRGGPELSIQYILSKVPPPPEFKACPVF